MFRTVITCAFLKSQPESRLPTFYTLILVSRRSQHRAGTRYKRRGVDAKEPVYIPHYSFFTTEISCAIYRTPVVVLGFKLETSFMFYVYIFHHSCSNSYNVPFP